MLKAIFYLYKSQNTITEIENPEKYGPCRPAKQFRWLRLLSLFLQKVVQFMRNIVKFNEMVYYKCLNYPNHFVTFVMTIFEILRKQMSPLFQKAYKLQDKNWAPHFTCYMKSMQWK